MNMNKKLKKNPSEKTYSDSLDRDIKFERGSYMKRVMTGMEAYRALWHCIDIWVKQLGPDESDFLFWLNKSMESNNIVQKEWELAIREMIKERDEGYGDDLHAYRLPNQEGVLKPCNCCDKCRFKNI